MKRYNPSEIEPKWQHVWAEQKTYKAHDDSKKPKYYALSFFPYPSGIGLHIGHVRNFTITDVAARFKRMLGHEVLHPMGWDSFGLPAENYAIKTGISPQEATKHNTDNFREQAKHLGLSIDWDREFGSTDPDYYKWTQWFFLLLQKRGLAYQKESMQFWCETDKTVLANEQVEAGKCWRCGNEVTKKSLKQWFFKITDYADQLAADLEDLDWPNSIKTMQRNWIGRSVGAEVEFVVGDVDQPVKDTLKFTPELTQMIKDGAKWSTIRLESKNLNVGDIAKLQTRYSKDEVRSFALARITAVQTMQLKDIPLNLAGHESYETQQDKLADYQKYYGQNVTPETVFTIYDFKKVADIITVFTTRADTLFGATFMVLAPEHADARALATTEQKQAVEDYIRQAESKTDIDRMDQNREKTGVFTGSYAINPVNGAKLPIWVADYVLGGYGTSAIVAVPAHDERDFAFAKKFDLPIIDVVSATTYDEQNPPQADKQNTERSTVLCVIKNQQGQFLTLKWNKHNWHTFVMGGIDGDEDLEVAARREIAEETGYTNLKFLGRMPFALNSIFYAAHKDVNRDISVDILQFELTDDARQSVKREDHEDFEVVWIAKDELASLQPVGGLDYIITWIEQGDFCYHGEGRLVNSNSYTGLETTVAREKIVADLAANGQGQEKVNYKIRDWLISRQRYWGAPIPIIHCPKDGIVPVPEDQLPVVLPPMQDYLPTGDGRSPLAKNRDWVDVECPKCGGPAERETDTMDGFACSSWYALRFADPKNAQAPFSREKVEHWAPVDLYVGGAEHAVMHLLYARMWTKVMHDAGLISFNEPFKALRNQGMLLAEDGTKFSKSKGNGVDPEDVINNGYGADALRTTMMFLAPFDQKTPWSPEGLGGVYRFLNRVWTLAQEVQNAGEGDAQESPELRRAVHKAIKKVTDDLHKLGFNTAIAALMELTNELYKLRATAPFAQYTSDWRWAVKAIAQMLAPFAPHLAEELWEQFGGEGSVHLSDWPAWDDVYLVQQTTKVVVQVNGKVRATIEVAVGTSDEAVRAAAFADDHVQEYIAGAPVKRVIVVPNKLINIVV